MRVLFTSTAGLGHFYPLVPMARAARAAGDEVRSRIAPEGLASVAASGFDPVPTAGPAPAALGRVLGGLAQAAEPNTYVHRRAVRPAERPRRAAGHPGGAWRSSRRTSSSARSPSSPARSPPSSQAIPHVTVGIGSMGLPDLTHQVVADEVDTAARRGRARHPSGRCRGSTRHPVRHTDPAVMWQSPDDVPADTRSTGTRTRRVRCPPATGPRARGRRRTVYATLGSVAGTMPFATRPSGRCWPGSAEVDADVLFTVGSARPCGARPGPRPTCTSRATCHSRSRWPATRWSATAAAVPRWRRSPAACRWWWCRCSPTRCTTPSADRRDRGRAHRRPAGGGERPAGGRRAGAHRPVFAASARSIATDLAELPSAAEVLAAAAPAGVH